MQEACRYKWCNRNMAKGDFKECYELTHLIVDSQRLYVNVNLWNH